MKTARCGAAPQIRLARKNGSQLSEFAGIFQATSAAHLLKAQRAAPFDELAAELTKMPN
jgi:hypothetical protein